jgi:hypothetical protein
MKGHNYITKKYTVSLIIAKQPHDVFKHLIDLSKWWPEDFMGEKINLNTEFVLNTGDDHVSKNKVVEFVPDKKLVWLTTESKRKADGYDWTGTKFIFELIPKGNDTELRFTYDGVVPASESERLVQICDMCIQELFYNFAVHGKAKPDLMTGEMVNKSFTATIEVTNSVKEIFQRITNDVAKWWGGEDLSGRSVNKDDEFVINHPGVHYSKQKLIEVISGEKLVWLVTDSKLSWLKNEEEWTNTKMVFEIRTKSGSNLLHFTHEGLVPEKESYVRCAEGWNMVIKDWLYTLITHGKAHF